MRANNLRKGMIILYNNAPYKIMDFHHVTPGKGQSVVQTKLRNLITMDQSEIRFRSTEDVKEADVYSSRATYLYKDSDSLVFMDTKSYEQFNIEIVVLGDDIFYLIENMEVEVTSFNEKVIGVVLPKTVVLEIVETEPEMKGATATNSPKPAITNTGLSLNVPQFVKVGDNVIVNTDSGDYLSRTD